MAKDDYGWFISAVDKRLRGGVPAAHGDFGEVSDTFVENKPWDMVYSNGIFRERNTGTFWKYFLAPEDVKTEWLTNPEDAVMNQMFLARLIRDLEVSDQSDNVRNDVRRRFHSQTTRDDTWGGIVAPKTFSPQHVDYMNRVSAEYSKPTWNTYVGVDILSSNIFYEANTVKERLERWWDNLTHPNDTDLLQIAYDLERVTNIFLRNGFRPLDFVKNYQDYVNMTAWHGSPNITHHQKQDLSTTRVIRPSHGQSLILPVFGEVQFHALRESDMVYMQDPDSPDLAWAQPLYNPSHNVISINIRGEIRSNKVMENLMGSKRGKTSERALSEVSDEVIEMMNATEVSEEALKSREGWPVLDNTEIIIGTKVPAPGEEESPIFDILETDHNLECALLRDRQHLGIMTTLPAYPRNVMRVPKGNRKRSHVVNVLMPGLIALSGLYRSTKPAAPDGIFIGLSPAGNEYREIYTQLSTKGRGNPVVLCSGRPGSGKTQTLLQIACQAAYEHLPAWYLNFKKEGTLKPTFDLIGGYVISMNVDFLTKSPGVLDPFLFLESREQIANIFRESLFSSMRLYYTADASKAGQNRTQISREITERCRDTNNKSLWDVIFGNGHMDPSTKTDPITDADVTKYVSNAIGGSDPFWVAFVGKTGARNEALAKTVRSGRSVLVEWDKSMSLPDAKKDAKDYSDSEQSMVNSMAVVFKYATSILSGTGGVLIADESAPLRYNREAMNILNNAGREWRSADICLILAAQNLTDWLGILGKESDASDTVRGFVSRYLIMAINNANDDDLNWFYKITKQPRSENLNEFLFNMGATKTQESEGNRIPRSWYHDEIQNWSGPIINGPYPQLELAMSRTDKEGIEARAKGVMLQSFSGTDLSNSAERINGLLKFRQSVSSNSSSEVVGAP